MNTSNGRLHGLMLSTNVVPFKHKESPQPPVFKALRAFKNYSNSMIIRVIWLQYHHQYIYFYLQFPLGRMIHHNLSRHIPPSR